MISPKILETHEKADREFLTQLDDHGVEGKLRRRILQAYERCDLGPFLDGKLAYHKDFKELIDDYTSRLQLEEQEDRENLRRVLSAVGVPELHVRNVFDREPEPGDALTAVR